MIEHAIRRSERQGLTRPAVALALCLLVFYAPMLLAAGGVITGRDGDVVAHLLISLGDARPAGRFFPYFDLAANARLWGTDVKYHPLHLIRLFSIALGAHPAGWGVLIVGVHSALFLVVYYYSRKILRVSTVAALTGAMVTFFATSWYEWTALVYWTAGTALLIVSVCEYWLFLNTARRCHLLACVLANVLQPYVTQSQALVPTQAYLLGAVVLMAVHRKAAWRSAAGPLLRCVWPLTALGWLPVLAPMLFVVGSGLMTREMFEPATWGFRGAHATQLLGVLVPAPLAASVLFDRLGWSRHVMPPARWLFGSFLFVPAVLALWRWGGRALRLMVIGVAVYCTSLIAAECVMVPSALIQSLGFHRSFAFPALSGFVVAAAAAIRVPRGARMGGMQAVRRGYRGLLACAVIALAGLLLVSERRLVELTLQHGLLGSGTALPGLLRGTRVFTAGIALGLAAYLWLTARHPWDPGRWWTSRLGILAAAVTVVTPAMATGYAEFWYERNPVLGAMLAPPPEVQFLRERIPNSTYRVGIVLASEMRLAEGDWAGFWTTSSEPAERRVADLRQHDVRLRQGLAFALPFLHFYGPVHQELRRAGNPFLQRWGSREALVLTRRTVIVRPEAEAFADYGVRYWLSTYDLERYRPGIFVRVYQGPSAAVYEHRHAKPVAYFLDEPTLPLPLYHERYGVRVALPAPRRGRLSVHLDLRHMDAQAVGADGRITSLTLEPAGRRWVVDLPPQTSAVVFTPKEIRVFMRLAAGVGVALSGLAVLTFLRRLAGMRSAGAAA